MTVPATTRRAGPFTGNGVTTVFPFTFKTFAKEQLAVTLTAASIDTLLVLDSDYTVTLNGDQDSSPGGTITYSTLGVTQRLTIISALEYEQTADLPTGGAFSPVVIENALDRQAIQVQQLAEQLGRALTLPVSAAGADTTLPSPDANKIIGWNEAGDGLVNYDVTEIASAAAYAEARTEIFDGAAASYTLTSSPGTINNTTVIVSGVVQTPGVDYTLSGRVLTPVVAWPAGADSVVVRYSEIVAQVPLGGSTEIGLSVVAYGANADGTDDAAFIQAAIDAAAATGVSTVYFPPGVYSVGTTVNIRSNVRLLGAGMGISVIQAMSTLGLTVPMMKNITGDPGFGLRTDSNIVFEALTFDGSGRTFPAYDQNTNPPTYGGIAQGSSRGHLIRMYSVINLRVLHCEFRNHHSNAPMVDCGGLNNLYLGCYFHDNGKIDDVSPCAFISPRSAVSTVPENITVKGCFFYDCDRMGLRFDVDGGSVEGCHFYNLLEGGIHIESGTRTIVRGNTFRNMTTSDIVCNGIELETDDPTDGVFIFDGNIFENIGNRAISMNGAANAVVTNNIILNCGGDVVFPTPNGPLNYAAGRSAGDVMPLERRCGIQMITADTYQVNHTIIANNVIRCTDGTSTQYGIVIGATGTPLETMNRIEIRDNVIDGMVLDRYFITEAALGAFVRIDDRNLEDLSLVTQFAPLADGYAVTGSPALTAVGGNGARVLALDAAATEDWQWTVPPPPYWPGGTVVGVVVWAAKQFTAGTGNVRLQLSGVVRPLAGTPGGGSFATQTYTQAVAADGSAGIEKFTFTLTTPWAFGADSHFLFRLARLGADGADTWGSDLYVTSVQLILRKDPEGF